MKAVLPLLFLFLSLTSFAQDDFCSLDDSPFLTELEAEFLNEYLGDVRGDFDFSGAKVIFVTGHTGTDLSTKQEYFEKMQEPQSIDSTFVTGVVPLSPSEKERSGGYDVILTYWVKTLSHKSRKRLVGRVQGRSLAL